MAGTATRDRIVETADALFYERGFEATSFADVAGAVGISRGNFYHHFKTKDAILDAVIDRRIAATAAMLDEWEAGADGPAARIRAFFEILIRNRAKIVMHGCPVGSLTLELAKLEHASQDRAAEIFTLFRDWLTAAFAELGAPPERAAALALKTLSRSQGAAVLASAYRDEAYLTREVEDFARWLDRIAAAKGN